MRRALAQLAVIVLACLSLANASATLLLEEPYGKLGFFTATGHAAVYLSGVCAETPIVLRPCSPGETGVVISRYNGVSSYDWVAIPLIPYLYAVERADELPSSATAQENSATASTELRSDFSKNISRPLKKRAPT